MAKILIVDNAAFMRSVLKYIMEGAGHEVVGLAGSGAEGLDLYKRLKPDIVTLDILMEDMSGLKLLELIRKFDPVAKAVMVSALGQDAKQEEARLLGASGYIKKPFKADEIVAEIGRVAAGQTGAPERAG